MAQKSKKKEDETKKVVAKCDHPNEVVANCICHHLSLDITKKSVTKDEF